VSETGIPRPTNHTDMSTQESAYINIPNLQRKPRIARTSPVHKTAAFAAEVVGHVIAAQHDLRPMLETGFEHFERLFEVGDVVVVAETVAG
jgi:hypothetical protein